MIFRKLGYLSKYFLPFLFHVPPFNFSFYLVPSSALVNGTDLIINFVKSVRVRSYSGPHFPAFGLSISPYSLRMCKNADQNNSEYGHFLRSDSVRYFFHN